MTNTTRPAEEDGGNGRDAVVAYIQRYGGFCRDCADENGVCPSSGLPCAGSDKAIRHVLAALDYGTKHGYLPAACTHQFHHFGDQKIRRCVNCDALEAPAAPGAAAAAPGQDAAEIALRQVLAVVRRYLPPGGPSAHDAISEIIAVVDPWPLGQLEEKS